jgi:protein-tyrosine-phosphatase
VPADTSAERPGAVLFTCNFNRVRSPMAEALCKLMLGRDVFVDSCGLNHAPADEEEADDSVQADPFVGVVMAELGYELIHHRAKTFDELEDDSFDLVISLTPESRQRAAELARGRAADIEFWPTPDPTLVDGSREARLDAYRDVRDALARRISKRFGAPLPVPIDLPPRGGL